MGLRRLVALQANGDGRAVIVRVLLLRARGDFELPAEKSLAFASRLPKITSAYSSTAATSTGMAPDCSQTCLLSRCSV